MYIINFTYKRGQLNSIEYKSESTILKYVRTLIMSCLKNTPLSFYENSWTKIYEESTYSIWFDDSLDINISD